MKTRMDLEAVILSKSDKRDKSCVIALDCGIEETEPNPNELRGTEPGLVLAREEGSEEDPKEQAPGCKISQSRGSSNPQHGDGGDCPAASCGYRL